MKTKAAKNIDRLAQPGQPTLAKLALMVSVIAWASAYVGIRFAVEQYSPGTLALFRYLIASIAMIPLYYFFKQSINHSWRNIVLVMLTGTLGFALYNVCLNVTAHSVSRNSHI